MTNSLLPFQEEGVAKMLHFLKESNACYNASEPGLGKTIMTIEALNRLSCGKVLVISPSIMKLTWAAEIMKWTKVPNPRICVILTGRDVRDSKGSNFTICSYGLASAPNIRGVLASETWDAIVVDENHMLKNRKTARTISVYGHLWPKARYRIGLSGTPFTNSITDGFTAFHNMSPDTFPDFRSFAGRYAYFKHSPWGPKYYGLRNGEELSKLIRSKFFLRYRKDEVLKELPDKTFSKVLLDSSFAVKIPKDAAEKVKLEAEMLIKALNSGESPSIPTNLASLRRMQAEAKLKPVIEFCKDFLDQDIPIVLFAYHRSVIHRLEVELASYKPLIITGDTSATDRFDRVKKFQDGESNLFIANMIAGGVGVTLTRSSNAIFVELDWNPHSVIQSCDRLHRIGQKNAVTIHYFVVKDSIEERIVSVLMDKAKTFSKVIDA